jgi:hypothetical protein
MNPLDRVNPVASSVWSNAATTHRVASAKDDRGRRQRQDAEPHDTVELHADEEREEEELGV